MNRILIAEDEPRLASFLEKGLRSNGFATTTVGDGAKAVMLADDEDFDLLVLDLGLPVKDGFTVLREMRAGGHRMPVIILSARDDVRDKVSGLEHGADDYVTKPFRFEELLARVRVRLRDDGVAEPTVLRAGDPRPAHTPRQRRRASRRPVGARVHDARGVHAPQRAGLEPRAAAVARLGLRLRPGLQRRRCLRRLPAPQARPRPDPDHARHGIPDRVVAKLMAARAPRDVE